MALFQKSVLNQYIKTLDKSKVADAYAKFKAHFHNATKQEEIRSFKEEQYQRGFIVDLFENIFQYAFPTEIITELKNETDSKKADGAILKNGNAVAVIELKGTNTTDLNKVTQQAFGYKNNQKQCKYVIISNFEKLRFYIDNAIDFEEFNLFTLSENEFTLLYVCLHKDYLLNDIPLQLKQTSTVKEENITKQLYKDYSDFKRKLFENIIHLNPQYDKLILFKKSQKLLDRILFILFAEDRNLIPANTIHTILNEWQQLQKLNVKVPLYDRFKNHFNYLNDGFKNDQYEVFGYNGGLFAKDEILDAILIDDNLLQNYTPTLSKYDYETEVDVNILGHIFEHSLNDIDEIQAQIAGNTIDKTKTKRKKDGVFYTPKYITKYIVENTVGALCTEKRNEYGVIEDNYTPDKRKAKKKELLEKLNQYQDWLLHITILDPACGSGAFLNQALDFLIQEHRNIDELRATLLGESMILPDHEVAILENNIFGVDLNDESVEIARLSLWLRTARKGRKLNSLNNNIKCGNSLIDDVSIAGDKAFNWQTEFPQIFERGGFDVVIGNPPYVSHDRIIGKDYLKINYKCFSAFTDLYSFFYEIGIEILKPKGFLYFITSNSFLKAEYGRPLRELIIQNTTIREVINIEETQMFGGATVNTVLLLIQKDKDKDIDTKCKVVNTILNRNDSFYDFVENSYFSTNQSYFTSDSWKLSTNENETLKQKIKSKFKTLEELNTQIRLGIATGDNNAFIIDEEKKKDLISKDSKSEDLIKPILRGRDINRYKYTFDNKYILLTRNEIDVVNNYKGIFEYLNTFDEKFKNRGAKGRHWTNLRACSFFDDFKLEKIVWIELTDKPKFTLITDEIYLLNSAYFILPPKGFSSKYLLSLLNSKVITFYIKMIANTSGVGTTRWINIYVKEFPIPQIELSVQQPFIEKVEIMLQKNKELQTIKSNVVKLLQSQYTSININTKLNNWNELSFKDFCAALEKQKIKLTISEKAELMQYFEAEQTKANTIQQTINQTDKEIDTMVYKLYELTDEEILIIEKN